MSVAEQIKKKIENLESEIKVIQGKLEQTLNQKVTIHDVIKHIDECPECYNILKDHILKREREKNGGEKGNGKGGNGKEGNGERGKERNTKIAGTTAEETNSYTVTFY